VAIVSASALSGVSGFPPVARAAPEDPAAAEAKKHYEEGTKAFNLGEYPRAIAEFKATYNAKPDPLLLYNIAQSYRLAGDASQALFFYKSFLRNMPDASNRKEVEGRVKTLEKQVAEQKKDPSTAPPPVIVPSLPLSLPSASPPGPGTESGSVSPPAAASSHRPETGSNALAAPESPRTITVAPSPPQPSPAPIVDVTTTPAEPAPEPSRPIYRRWWFWAGTVGAVVIVGALAAANAKKGPNTALGTYDPTFTPLPNP
jgi:hypothetical protein